MEPPCKSSMEISVRNMNVLYLPLSGGFQEVDGNGHGTHCAGTAVSSQLCAAFVQQYSLSAAYVLPCAFSGVAKSANVVAVKVLGDDGSGQNSDM